ncbi:MAG: hypothetical protein LBD79_06885 [Treponema sp.]|jgi:hypothetical protein|nr:hypothetical protein [Treponema sp.]
MKKVLLYKPEADEVDVNVVTYANEAFFDWGCSKNTSGCSKKPDKGFDFLCKKGGKGFDFLCKKGDTNKICPQD